MSALDSLLGEELRAAKEPLARLVTLETGAVVQVPAFVAEGDTIRVDTRTGDYISRGKN